MQKIPNFFVFYLLYTGLLIAISHKYARTGLGDDLYKLHIQKVGIDHTDTLYSSTARLYLEAGREIRHPLPILAIRLPLNVRKS